ncbi:MAG: WYL domain-containing protein [Bacteroidota bacterium]
MQKTLPRQRVIEILLKVLASPNTYTKRQLANQFGVNISQIKEDFKHIRAAGITVEQEKSPPYRYTILPQRGFRELQYLQQLSESDQGKIKDALYRTFGRKDALYISNKLASLYNFQQLGIRALRRPSLDRIDLLQQAKQQKRQVLLKNYRSNSGSTKDRLVEPFDVDVELDTLQAFEIEKSEVRHYRLARIERVQISDQTWQYEAKHKIDKTDVFRIANDQQVYIHLKLKAQALNYLAENYHKALSDIHPASEVDIWDFETPVNENFYGLSNFILAHFEHIQIIEPQILKHHIQEKANAILSQFQ